jgi:hypothetical protein
MPENTFASPDRIVSGLDAEIVIKRPASLPHSIYEELWHLNFWQSFILAIIHKESPAYPTQASESWPQDNALVSQESWRQLVDTFMADLKTAVDLAGAQQLSPALSAQLIDLATHNAYHFGRIVVLRQLLAHW